MNYEWKIAELYAKDEQVNDVVLKDVVVKVKWVKIGTDENGNVGKFFGTSTLTISDTTSFVEFNSLTQYQVVSWIESLITVEEAEQINKAIQEEIDKNAKAVKQKLIPWG